MGLFRIVNTPVFDKLVHAVKVMDSEHSHIHGGHRFYYDDTHVLTAGTGIDHLIITPDTNEWAHFVWSIGSTGGQITVEMFEGPTITDIGVIEPMFNRNRNSTREPTTLLYENPVNTAKGERIDRATFGTKDRKSIGGGGRGDAEIILKQGTMYLFTVLELGLADTVVNLTFDWYEHNNVNVPLGYGII